MTSLKSQPLELVMHKEQETYRPDIDGLRAIAVLSVVIFHAFPSTLKGGFIGVDIFFVISGYLISKIIFSSLDKNKFSIYEFYSRRINRIFPALIIVFIFCLAFGWFSLMPSEYKNLGKHTAGGAGFFANFLLWRESGYFDTTSETKPLLHLWSLAIEEQFYILWPALLIALWKFKSSRIFIILAITTISLFISIKYAQGDQSAAYYSPLSRFWELMIGSTLAYLTAYRSSLATSQSLFSYRSTLRNTQAIVGTIMIAFGFFTITKDHPFPGYWALFPTIGAALIIAAGPHAFINKKILSNRLMVGIGLISFPLYLWHWPLLSFVRIIETETPSDSIRLAVVTTSILLAFLTYQLVEKPIRLYAHGRKRAISLLLIMFMIGAAGLSIYIIKGFPERDSIKEFSQKFQELENYSISSCNINELKEMDMSWCNQSQEEKKIDYIIWGDSHAEHLMPGLKKSSSENWYLIGRHSCPPLNGVKIWSGSISKDSCKKANTKSLEIISQSKTSIIILASMGPVYFSSHGVAAEHKEVNDKNPNTRFFLENGNNSKNKLETFKEGLESSIFELNKLGKKVVLVRDIAEHYTHPKACLKRPFKNITPNCDVPKNQYDERYKNYIRILDDIKKNHPNVYIFDAAEAFCDTDKCISSDSQNMYFRDGHHLSEAGSAAVARKLAEFVEQNLK